MSKINLYCCGGASANIGKHFVKYHGRKDAGFSELATFFIDVSRSNLSDQIPDDIVYLVDGLDGSGKRRDSNYAILAERSKEILHRFKPTDLNIVLHSASGGTGSTVGPIIVSELLERNEPVVVITIGSTGSRKETDNTVNTLKSYEMISRKRGLPVNVHYRENTDSLSRGQVDNEVQLAILILTAIFSGQNRELDSSDLKNFLNYTRVTSYSPKLSLLDFFSDTIVIGKGQSVISLVTLVDDVTASDTHIPVEYQAVGFLSDQAKESVTVNLPIHACVISGYFNSIIDTLNKKLTEFDEVRQIVNEKPIISDNEQSTDEGLIL